MSKKFSNLQVGLDENLEERLRWMFPDYSRYIIHRKSVDARRRHEPHWVYSGEVFDANETPPDQRIRLEKISEKPPDAPLIVGAGPAGLFAALRLVERGIPCHIFEQGSVASERMKRITRFWRYGNLDPLDNVCFGEGGAGLYSDGKLITRIKSPHIQYVTQRLVDYGAPEEIAYLANPHVGSDRIRRIIPKLREAIEAQGGKFHFNKQVSELLIRNNEVYGLKLSTGEIFESSSVLIACGHSANEFLDTLRAQGIQFVGKSFAMGLRIEHPQALINQIQYRQYADHPLLGAANYKLTCQSAAEALDVYSFCMCPGGYVLSSGTEADGIVCNGMSNYRRNSPYANAALVVTVDHDRHFGEDLLGGMRLRRELERGAFLQVKEVGGTKEIPAQSVPDFLAGRNSTELETSSPSGVKATRLDQLVPAWMREALVQALQQFERKMPGFIGANAVLHGVESRTSCPLRMTRDSETLQSVSHRGLYPVGEGAGYAGGITSAACDGVRVAEQIYVSAIAP